MINKADPAPAALDRITRITTAPERRADVTRGVGIITLADRADGDDRRIGAR